MSWICVKLKFLELYRLEGPGIIYLLLKAGPLIAGCSGPCSKEFQGWRSHNLSALDFDHPHGCWRGSNKLVWSCNFSCSHLYFLPLIIPLTTPKMSLAYQEVTRQQKNPPFVLLLFHANQATFSHPVLLCHVFQPLTSLVALCWTHSGMSASLLFQMWNKS